MALLGDKIKTILGVDLGASSLKLVELRVGDGHPTLTTYGVADIDIAGKATAAHENADQIVDVLQDVISQSRSSAKEAIAALSSLNVFTTFLEVPEMPEKELQSAIRWEARKLLPLPIDKMKVDWHVLGERELENKEKKLNVIITAAPQDVIDTYLQIFRRSNLRLVGLETEAAAIGRALIPPETQNVLIIDIGATTTNLIIFVNQTPVIVRHTDIGGSTITHNIENALNVTVDRAEQFKKNLGIQISGDSNHPASRSIKFVIDNLLLQEIRRIVDAFQGMQYGALEHCILTGGGSLLKNIDKYLEHNLGMSVTLGDPWTKVAYPEGLKDQLEPMGVHMSVALGLALKQANLK